MEEGYYDDAIEVDSDEMSPEMEDGMEEGTEE